MLDEFRKCINCPCGNTLLLGVWLEDDRLKVTVHDSIRNFAINEKEEEIRQAVYKIRDVLDKISKEADRCKKK